jgi:drug/metabolite transporter (DMT)-like permease
MLIGTITGFIAMLFDFEMPQKWDWVYLILIGVTTQYGQIHMTKSLQISNIAEVSILNYLGVLYAILAGYFIFNESYGWLAILGIAFVIGGVVMNVVYTAKAKQV